MGPQLIQSLKAKWHHLLTLQVLSFGFKEQYSTADQLDVAQSVTWRIQHWCTPPPPL